MATRGRPSGYPTAITGNLGARVTRHGYVDLAVPTYASTSASTPPPQHDRRLMSRDVL
jgi:hypothetical protein